MVRRPLTLTLTTWPCKCFLTSPSRQMLIRNRDSTNTTVKGSRGFVSANDAAYVAIPADSRKPAAPIDPSSTSHFCFFFQDGNTNTKLTLFLLIVDKSFFISSASA